MLSVLPQASDHDQRKTLANFLKLGLPFRSDSGRNQRFHDLTCADTFSQPGNNTQIDSPLSEDIANSSTKSID
jgi:hypothetical protein